jgi:hypothetical protein
MLRRLLLVMSVAALMAAMLAVTAVPAFATIHPLAEMERASDNASPVVQSQDPPGLTGQGQGLPPNNPLTFLDEGPIAQPVFQANENAFKPADEEE